MIISDIKRAYSSMSAAEQRVANFILADPARVTGMSMAELSKQSGTSDASVMRMCKAIGQKGFYQLKINIAMESASAPSPATDIGDEPRNDVTALVDSIAKDISRISMNITTEQITACVEMLKAAHTVYLFGWGNTSTIAQDLAHRLLRFGISTFCTDNIEYIMRSVTLAGNQDALVAFSHSGSSVYTIECMKLAHEGGLKVILIGGERNPGEATKLCDLILSTGVTDTVISGHESHVPELVVCDLILDFMDRNTARYQAGARSEAILGQFKL